MFLEILINPNDITYDFVTLEEIWLDTNETFVNENMYDKDKSILIYKAETETEQEYIYPVGCFISDDKRYFKLEMEFNRMIPWTYFRDKLYIVRVKTTAHNCDIPCSKQKGVEFGYAYEETRLYKDGLNMLGVMQDTCDIPRGFIEYYLKMKALEFALKTCHFIHACKYWNKYFYKKNKKGIFPHKCGCHGRTS